MSSWSVSNRPSGWVAMVSTISPRSVLFYYGGDSNGECRLGTSFIATALMTDEVNQGDDGSDKHR
jgi:hypothetical protein